MRYSLEFLYSQNKLGFRPSRDSLPTSVRFIDKHSNGCTYVHFEKPVDLSLLEVAAVNLGMRPVYFRYEGSKLDVDSLKIFDGEREVAEIYKNATGIPFPCKPADPATVQKELELFDEYLNVYNNGMPRLVYGTMLKTNL